MDTLLRVGLSNAVAACVLAVIARLVGYFCRRPAVRHALWLLVLLKLVTPPLIDIHIWQPPPHQAPVAEAPATDDPVIVVADAEREPSPDPVGAAVVVDEVPPQVVVEADEPAAPAPTATPQPKDHDEPAAAPPWNWRPLLLAVWIGGAVIGLALTLIRVRRFSRLLAYAEAPPAWLQREVDGLARRLGLARSPRLGLLPGRLSPMLWALGWSAYLLLPSGLLNRLDAAGRRTLLAHELAHLRRRDHRVRLFELLVTLLFWWHPIVWWARRELREAEEQCCDAWVLWALPQSAKTYALALVETVDYLSEVPAALPALASGVGHVYDLKRRVAMIMQGTTPRALTWRGLLGLCGLGLFLLPVMPSWGQEAPQEPIRVQLAPADADANKAKAELERLTAELKAKEAELKQLQVKVYDAQKRLQPGVIVKDATIIRDKQGGVIVLELVDGNSRQVIKLPAGSRVLGAPIDGKIYATDQARFTQLQKAADAAKVQQKAGGLILEIISNGKRQVIELPPGSRVLTEQPREIKVAPSLAQPDQPLRIRVIPETNQKLPAVPGYQVLPKPSAPADTEKRLDNLEKRLEELMRAVREMRGEMQKGKPSPKTGVGDLEIQIQNLDLPIQVKPVFPGDAPKPK